MGFMMSVKFGIRLPTLVHSYPPPRPPHHALQYAYRQLDFDLVRKVALDAERLGYHSVWIADHLGREACRNRFEGWTVLSALASLTKRIRLGNMVLCNLYRHPGLVATMATTADILSGGRLELGIGAGWNQDECRGYGIEFPRPKTRLDMLKESVEIIKRLWTEEKVTYQGKHYNLEKAFCEPKPIQKPHPPILIGGGGEHVTLRIVARYADKSNFGGPIEVVSRKLEALKRHCAATGRNYDSIEKSCGIDVAIHPTRDEYLDDMRKRYLAENSPGPFDEWFKKTDASYVSGTPENCLKKIREYARLGISLFEIRFGDIPSRNGIELFAKHIIPEMTKGS